MMEMCQQGQPPCTARKRHACSSRVQTSATQAAHCSGAPRPKSIAALGSDAGLTEASAGEMTGRPETMGWAATAGCRRFFWSLCEAAKTSSASLSASDASESSELP